MRGKQTTNHTGTSAREKRPKRRRKGIVILNLFIWIFLIPFFILIIIGMVNAPSEQESKQSKMPVKAIGQPAEDAGFRFVVNSLKCGEKRISYNDGLIEHVADAQGQFCRLNITVTNSGNTANSIRAYNQHVLNAQGQKYDHDAGATGRAAQYILGHPFDDDINPGNSITGDIVFDVPADVMPTMAELHGDSDSLGARINLQ